MSSRSSTGDAATTAVTARSRTRVHLVTSALALSSAAVAFTLLWHPGPERNDLSYAAIAPVRDAAWTAAVVDHVGFVVAAFTLGIAVCVLAPARGATWANLGAALAAVGGILFGGGVFAYGVLSWYATAVEAIPVESGTALMTYFADNPAHLSGPQIAGFLVFNLGTLLLVAALWRAGSVPRWLLVVWAVLTVGQFAGLPGRVLDLVQVGVMTIFIAIAWFAAHTPDRTR